MLQGFLDKGLYAALRVAHLVGEAAHLAHVEPACQQEERHDKHHDARQHLVHIEEEEKCPRKLHHRVEEVGQALGEEARHVAHVALDAVDEVPAVELFQREPVGGEQFLEAGALHLAPPVEPQRGGDPPRRSRQGYLHRRDDAEQHEEPRERPLVRHARGGVDGEFRHPHEEQPDAHAGHADKEVEEELQPQPFPHLEKVAQYLRYRAGNA